MYCTLLDWWHHSRTHLHCCLIPKGRGFRWFRRLLLRVAAVGQTALGDLGDSDRRDKPSPSILGFHPRKKPNPATLGFH